MSSRFPDRGAVAYLIHSVETIPYRARCHITQVISRKVSKKRRRRPGPPLRSQSKCLASEKRTRYPLTGHAILTFSWAT